jgi:ribosomal protein L31
MNVRRSFVQTAVALTVVVAMPLLGLSGVASAKATHASKSATWCAKHPKKKALCPSAGGGASGQGAGSPEIQVSAVFSPVIQVEANPSFAGDPVVISSSQLAASCGGIIFLSVETGTITESPTNTFTVYLDDDGNADVIMSGLGNCAPGDNTVDASLEVAPYYTALTDYVNYPDVVTPPGVFGLPLPSEVEVGDSPLSGNSDVYASFDVEAPPVYAEENAEISDTQLESSCGGGYFWIGANGLLAAAGPVGPGVAQTITPPVVAQLDDDGNTGVVFLGISCAATTTTVIADVDAGTHPTYTSTFTVDAPQVT